MKTSDSAFPQVALRHLYLASTFAPAITLFPSCAAAVPSGNSAPVGPPKAGSAKKVSVAPVKESRSSAVRSAGDLKSRFITPPDSARPWVYWYFMDGHVTKEGLHADLEAMKKAGIGGGIYLEVGIGVPRGPVNFMSPEWQDDFKYAVSEAKRLGLQIALGTGPGWTGSGGPWVKPEQSMQHLVASETAVMGPTHFDAVLPRPKPRDPYFGQGSMNDALRQKWSSYYQDEVVLAFPTPEKGARIDDTDHKAMVYRAPYTSTPGTPPRIPAPASFPIVPAEEVVSSGKIINLTDKLGPDGHLNWDVPAGNWTIMRFGRTTTGTTTRPAPDPGLGFESDKFSQAATAEHLKNFTGVLLNKLGPNYRQGDSGLTMIHLDSWEMSSQNWTQGFKGEFIKRRGYDPTPFLPAMTGYVVETPEKSERFLWDLRQTTNELTLENYAGYLKKYAHERGLSFSAQMYDMNPTSDLDLGGIADLPSCEFWSRGFGFGGEFSCFEAVSAAHTNGRNVVGAESFTANPGEDWQQYPGRMKNQLDWALCTGINKFVFHRYQHQPNPGQLPGMSMGPYGVHWEATQTFWDMVPAFHKYISRSSEMLRQGTPVADILYLTPEGAPQVFTPPPTATAGLFPDRKGYNFDGCSSKALMAKAKVQNGRIQFPGGASYKLLVLPSWETMTPELLRKITALVEAGATVMGAPPLKSPSLVGYPASDAQVQKLAAHLWGKAPYAASRKVGKGQVFYYALKPATGLKNAHWIWNAAGSPNQSAPVETLSFSKTIPVDSKRAVTSATATFTADDGYELFVNGKSAGTGDTFTVTNEMDLTGLLKPGSNQIRVSATNIGNSPNPAGLIGAISVMYSDGTEQVFNTGADWSVSKTPGGPTGMVMELGGPNTPPWGNVDKSASIYAPYGVTAGVLSQLGVKPDFSSGAPLRHIHRRLNQGDIYFVGNTAGTPVSTTATFRTAGRTPEWWNPVTGESKVLTDFKVSGGQTSIPVRLAGYESGFVIFRQPLATKRVVKANFATFRAAKTLSQPWNVAFDSKWGAPASITFPKLEDWSQRPEPGIKYYSGKATYTTRFDAPSIPKNAKVALGLGMVKDMAAVKLNGRDLGVVWTAPWQANIPAGLLKPKGNTLEVTVANLWINRLIGDESIPEKERKTQTTYRPYRANSPLQPSGLLGPVTIQIADY